MPRDPDPAGQAPPGQVLSPAEHAGWTRQGHLWRRVAAIALATIVLAGVASSDALHGALLELFRAADRIIAGHPVAGPVVFLLLAAGSAMFAFVSSAVLVPAGLVAWGQAATLGLLWAGWILGGVTAYAIARYLGRPVVAMLSASTPLARWEERLSHRTPFGVILLFQLAVPSEVPGYVLGFLRYPLSRYLAALALGELPFAAGTVYLGASFLARQTLLLVGLGAVGAGGSLLAFRALHRRLAGRPAASSAEGEGQAGRR